MLDMGMWGFGSKGRASILRQAQDERCLEENKRKKAGGGKQKEKTARAELVEAPYATLATTNGLLHVSPALR